MYKYGQRSQNNINSVHPSLKILFMKVLETYDHSILCGFRDEDAQTEAFETGKSKVEYPDSNHNVTPSKGIDVAPYPPEWRGLVKWDDIERWYHFAGYVLATAEHLGIKVRWGGNWDGDMDLKDQNFFDLVHWEIIE